MSPAIHTLALRLARQSVEASIRAQGHKLSDLSLAELCARARAYLTNHPDLISEAEKRYPSIIKGNDC